jgi:Na+-transporting NADH:ubiquinone oxidoreductase subunit F
VIEVVLAVSFLSALLVGLAAMLYAVRGAILPTHPVTITVNGVREVAAKANFKLLDILNAAGIAVPSGCAGAGTCGLCRVSDVTHCGSPLPTEKARLTPTEVREGVRLACQIVVRSDLSVKVPEEVLGVTNMTCTVASTKSVTPLIKEITLTLPRDTAFNFRAGSFVQVTAPAYNLSYRDIVIDEGQRAAWDKLGLSKLSAGASAPVNRAYSVANRPEDEGRVVLNVRLATPPPAAPGAPPGIVSSWLFGLRKGDRVAIAGPYGHFGAQESDKEMVFIGGGVGMAPLRAIIFDQLDRLGTPRAISFWYGARSQTELFYAEEFDALAARHDNFRWVPALSEPAEGDAWRGETGFIHEVVYRAHLHDHPAPEDCEYYLCGPPLMIDAVHAVLAECGVETASIHSDDFGI